MKAGTEQKRQEMRAIHIGIGGLVLASAVCVTISLTSYVHLLNVLIPVLCVGFGAWFLVLVPQYYVGFSFWLWFITPFLRRYLDYKVGYYSEEPVVMITPFLVSGLALLSVMRHWRATQHPFFFPLKVSLVATVYGLILTLGFGSPIRAVTAFLGWAGPILLAMFVLIHWRKYEQIRATIATTFSWAMLVLGAYSMVQYFFFPPWDKMWMLAADMGSIGLPQPLKVRVWSLLNSPGPFATVLMACLVFGFIRNGTMAAASKVFGVVGLVLSSVRSAWGGFLVAVIIAFGRSDGALKQRLLVTLVISVCVGVPLFLKSPIAAPISDQFSNRMDSMDNIENDGSFQARLGLYANAPGMIMRSPLGRGYASTGFDSGWITILVQLGWLGGAFYIFGMLRFAWLCFVRDVSRSDHFSMLAFSVSAALVVMMIAGGQHSAVLGSFMWALFAVALASSFQGQN